MRRFSVARSAWWSATWATGVTVGVALGGYLTVTSGSGAPGGGALDATEIVWMPLLSGVTVFVLTFIARVVVGLVRVGRPSGDPDEQDSGDHD